MESTPDTIKEVAEVIKANPGAIARLDNDNWTLRKPAKMPDFGEDWRAEDAWIEAQELIHSSYPPECDLLPALALLAGIETESA